MKNINIVDTTLCCNTATLSFKEKLEIARQLEKLNVDTIELPVISNKKADTLLVRTISSFVKNSKLSVAAGMTTEGIEDAATALSGAERPRIRVELPVSPMGMEYTCHLKAPKMLAHIGEMVAAAKEKCQDVEFCALDATRAENKILVEAINVAIQSGATAISVCDSTGEIMPDEFAKFVENLAKDVPELEKVELGVVCDDKNGMANSSAILAAKTLVNSVKTSTCGNVTSLSVFANIVKNCGKNCDLSISIKHTELNRIIKQILRVIGKGNEISDNVEIRMAEENVFLDKSDDISAVIAATQSLGYDLSEEDSEKVFEEFKRVSAKKEKVGAKELDAIVASVALQVPPTYKLLSYVVNSGNIITASAQLKLKKADGEEIEGISFGDGPIDAAYRCIVQVIGSHYELDDFQIQSVTEGREAVGAAVVRLREGGKLYSGSGISTDIIGASIRAYLGAVNKIVYEEV